VVQDSRGTRGEPVWVVVLTHEALEHDMRAALAEIDALEVVRRPARLIRIAGDADATGGGGGCATRSA